MTPVDALIRQIKKENFQISKLQQKITEKMDTIKGYNTDLKD